MDSEQQNVDKKTNFKVFLTWLGIYVLIFAITMLGSLFCIRAVNNNYRYIPVTGTSMQPTINPEPTLVYNEERKKYEERQDAVFIKVTKDISVNDIVIIQEDPNNDDTIIKRVIAMDGDMITILIDNFSDRADNLFHTFVVRKGTSTLERFDESFIAEEDLASWSSSSVKVSSTNPLLGSSTKFSYDRLLYSYYFSGESSHLIEGRHPGTVVTYEINGQKALFYKLADDEIFFMGDHRSVSSDARMRGTVSRDKIVGKVVDFLHDAYTYESNGTLWWRRLSSMFSYFWAGTENYFAW